MPTKFTDAAQKKVEDLLVGSGKADPDSPFTRDEKGNVIHRFDQITVKNLTTGVEIEYWWHGKHVSTQHQPYTLTPGDSVTLTGITGSMGVTIQ